MDLSPPQLDALHEGYKVMTTPPDQSGAAPKKSPRKRGRPRV